MGNLDFDTANVELEETTDDFKPLPEGTYIAEIQEGVVKTGKAGENYLEISMKILDENRWVWDRFFLWYDSSPKAKKVANERFAELAFALGMKKVGDTDELYLKRVQVKLGIEPANGQYSAKNNVVMYSSVTDSPSAAVNPGQPAAATTPPWA